MRRASVSLPMGAVVAATGIVYTRGFGALLAPRRSATIRNVICYREQL